MCIKFDASDEGLPDVLTLLLYSLTITCVYQMAIKVLFMLMYYYQTITIHEWMPHDKKLRQGLL